MEFLIVSDLKMDNILVGVEDESIIKDMIKDEEEDPCPQKIDGDRIIYSSRIFGELKGIPGRPKLADFGLAVRGDTPNLRNYPIQADSYRAPEVILRAGWSYSADIWNLGAMVSG